jgi:Domain of unknown function (DUF4234)
MSAANDVKIEGGLNSAKVRNPWLVLIFTLLTLGIYWAFWWYFINREMRDLGRARRVGDLGDSPGLSVVALTLGSLVYVPWIWTIVTTTQRVRRAQRLTGTSPGSAWTAAAIWIFTLTLGGPVYLQYQLNRVWRAPAMLPKQKGEWTRGDLERVAKLEQLQRAGALSENEYNLERARLGV